MGARGLLMLAAAMAFAACTRDSGRRPDVYLLVVDALRADHVARGDGGESLTPFLDQLAAKATVFRGAHAASSWTSPSIASLFTSRLSSQHGVVNFRSGLADGELTLAEALHAAGYRTAAFSGNVLLAPASGMAQGFTEFVNVGKPEKGSAPKGVKPRAEEIDRAALAWLDVAAAGGPRRPPFFVYLHYMETHTPYAPSPSALERVRTARGHAAAELEDLYAAELVSLDDELRIFFAELARRGMLDDALVVFTADHGEEFLEHGRLGHGQTLYEEVLRVPLLLWRPGVEVGSEVRETVSLVDVAPTILAAAGVDVAPSFEGRSLRGRLDGGAEGRSLRERLCALTGFGCASPPTSFAELLVVPGSPAEAPVHHERAAVADGRKLIQSSDGEVAAYDLTQDPGEARPLGEAAVGAGALRRSLAALVSRANRGGETRPTFDIETRERLRALGYGVGD